MEPKEQRTPILATTSILFHVRGQPYIDNEEANQTINAIVEKLGAAVRAAFKDDSSVEAIGVISFRYPKDERSNIHRCARCGRLLTDHNQPNPCDGLMGGYWVNGEFLCTEHYEMAVDSGEIPRPEGYWTSSDEPDES